MGEGSRRQKQREEKDREKGMWTLWRHEREAESNKSCSYQMGLTIFNVFIKMLLSNVI